MRISTTLFVSCLLAACYGQLLPCAPNCRHEDDGALFPNPRECSRFFQCAYHIAIPHKCPAGLFFNPVVQVCDFPDSAGCVLEPDCSDGKTTTTAVPVETTTVVDTTIDASTVATTTGPIVTTGGTTTAVYTTSKVLVTTVLSTTTPDAVTTTAQSTVTITEAPGSTTVSGECRPECPSAEAMYPNPRDCSSFFKCAFGHPFLLHCPAGQWYDGPNERCDYIELVDCHAGPDAPCVAVTNPTEPPQETTTVVSGPTTTDGGDDCKPPCPSDEALYANPRDCGSFYQCSFGVPYLMQCPAGQEYAVALERCDYPEVAECTAGPDSPCVAVTKPPQFVVLYR